MNLEKLISETVDNEQKRKLEYALYLYRRLLEEKNTELLDAYTDVLCELITNKDKDINDQLVDLILVEKKRNYLHSLIVLARMFLFGIKNIRKSKLVTIRKCKKIHIENHSNELFTMDGEQEEFLKKDLTLSEPITVIYNKRD